MGGALISVDEKPAAPGKTIGDVNLGFGSNTLGINLDAGVKSAKQNVLFYGFRFGGQSHTSMFRAKAMMQKIFRRGRGLCTEQ